MGAYGINRIWRAVWPVLLYHAISNGTAYALGRITGDGQADPAAAALISTCIMLPVLLWEIRKDGGTAAGMPRRILICAGCFAAGAILSVCSGRIMDLFGLYERFGNETQMRILAAPLPILLAGPGLLVPLAEEAAFRGLLYRRLKEITGPRYALLISSLLFAAGHGNVIQFLYALPMACILCLVYEWAKEDLAAPVLMHMGANLISVFL